MDSLLSLHWDQYCWIERIEASNAEEPRTQHTRKADLTFRIICSSICMKTGGRTLWTKAPTTHAGGIGRCYTRAVATHAGGGRRRYRRAGGRLRRRTAAQPGSTTDASFLYKGVWGVPCWTFPGMLPRCGAAGPSSSKAGAAQIPRSPTHIDVDGADSPDLCPGTDVGSGFTCPCCARASRASRVEISSAIPLKLKLWDSTSFISIASFTHSAPPTSAMKRSVAKPPWWTRFKSPTSSLSLLLLLLHAFMIAGRVSRMAFPRASSASPSGQALR